MKKINIMNSVLVGGVIILGLAGCQTVPYQGQAHDVKRKPRKEGIVAVQVNPKPEDRNKAEEHMASNCNPLKFEIVEEGEVVVGQKTQSNARESERESTRYKAGSLFGIPIVGGQAGGTDTSTSSVTEAVKEWQISYKCIDDKGNRAVR